MKCLVFGASGQVARSLAALSSTSTPIVCIGRPKGDITQIDSVEASIAEHAPDVVINAAAYTAVDKAENDEAQAYAINADGPENLAIACAKTDVPLIHYSTDYVFDGSGEAPWRPDQPTSPLGVYGRSKLEGETRIAAHHPKHIILRTAWVYAPFGQNFLKTMLRLGAERDSLKIVDDQYGNPTYAPDIAVASLDIARQVVDSNAKFGIYHLTNSGDTNWFGFAYAIFKEAENILGISCQVSPITSADYLTPAERPKNSRLDSNSLQRDYRVFMPSWQDALKRCIRTLAAEVE